MNLSILANVALAASADDTLQRAVPLASFTRPVSLAFLASAASASFPEALAIPLIVKPDERAVNTISSPLFAPTWKVMVLSVAMNPLPALAKIC